MSPTAADRAAALRLWVIVSRVYGAFAEHARRDVARRGLAVSEFAVLEVLYHKGELPIGEIGQRVLLTSGSMTYVIGKLVRRRLVVRRRCARDRRITYVGISPTGRRLMARIFPLHAEAIRRAAAGLSAADKRRAAVLLKRLGRHAQALLDRELPSRGIS